MIRGWPPSVKRRRATQSYTPRGGPAPPLRPARRSPLRFPPPRNARRRVRPAALALSLAPAADAAGRRWETDGLVFFGRGLQLQIGSAARSASGASSGSATAPRSAATRGSSRSAPKTVIGQECTISAYQHVRIGEQCVIADRAMFIDFDHGIVEVEPPDPPAGHLQARRRGRLQRLDRLRRPDPARRHASATTRWSAPTRWSTRDIPANAVAARHPGPGGPDARGARVLRWPDPVEPRGYGPPRAPRRRLGRLAACTPRRRRFITGAATLSSERIRRLVAGHEPVASGDRRTGRRRHRSLLQGVRLSASAPRRSPRDAIRRTSTRRRSAPAPATGDRARANRARRARGDRAGRVSPAAVRLEARAGRARLLAGNGPARESPHGLGSATQAGLDSRSPPPPAAPASALHRPRRCGQGRGCPPCSDAVGRAGTVRDAHLRRFGHRRRSRPISVRVIGAALRRPGAVPNVAESAIRR